MKRTVFLLVLLFISIASESQTGQKDCLDMEELFLSTEIYDSDGEIIKASWLINRQQLVIMVFAFKGCHGCRLSIEETIMPNTRFLEKDLGAKIIIVSREKEENRAEALYYYNRYPFDLYFNPGNELFAHMPVVPLSDGRRLKAYPTVVVFNNNYKHISVDPFNIEDIERACRLLLKNES